MVGTFDINNAYMDVFAGFSGNWGEGMSSEEYADMLRSENISVARTVEDW